MLAYQEGLCNLELANRLCWRYDAEVIWHIVAVPRQGVRCVAFRGSHRVQHTCNSAIARCALCYIQGPTVYSTPVTILQLKHRQTKWLCEREGDGVSEGRKMSEQEGDEGKETVVNSISQCVAWGALSQ